MPAVDKPEIREYCPNCKERRAEIDGDNIIVMHFCKRSRLQESFTVEAAKVDFVRGLDV